MLAVPLGVAEPLKLATVFIAGAGHWIVGLVAMLVAYAVSLFVTHWLFVLVKPQLLTLPWFARGWELFVAFRNKFWRWLAKTRSAVPYRPGRSPRWVKVKNPNAPGVKREAEEDWGH